MKADTTPVFATPIGRMGRTHPATRALKDTVEKAYRALAVLARQVRRAHRNPVASHYAGSDLRALHEGVERMRKNLDSLNGAVWVESNGRDRAFKKTKR